MTKHPSFISPMTAVIKAFVTASARNYSLRLLYRPRVATLATLATRRSHYTYASPGQYTPPQFLQETVWKTRDFHQRGFTVGIGGPVGSGKTALVLSLTQWWKQTLPDVPLGVVTNDIFTQEDAEFLTHHKALPAHRIAAVETGGCPHAAIREDVSANVAALERLTAVIRREQQQIQRIPLLMCESGGDNLAANFSRELADVTLYVIDVAGGDKIPRKGGPGITQSDLLIINKTDLAEAVGSSLDVMIRDANKMRTSRGSGNNMATNHHHDHAHDDNVHNHHDHHDYDHDHHRNNGILIGPTQLCSVRHNQGVKEVSNFILDMYYRAAGQTKTTK